MTNAVGLAPSISRGPSLQLRFIFKDGSETSTNRSASRLAAHVPRVARRTGIVEKCKEGEPPGTGRNKTFRGPHRRLQPPAVPDAGRGEEPAQGVVYFNDDGDIVALRFDNWKVVFMEQRVEGTLRIGPSRS